MLLYDTLQKPQANIDPLNWLISSPADHSTTFPHNNASQRPRWGRDPGWSCVHQFCQPRVSGFSRGSAQEPRSLINTEGSTFHLSCTCLFFRKKIKYTPWRSALGDPFLLNSKTFDLLSFPPQCSLMDVVEPSLYSFHNAENEISGMPERSVTCCSTFNPSAVWWQWLSRPFGRSCVPRMQARSLPHSTSWWWMARSAGCSRWVPRWSWTLWPPFKTSLTRRSKDSTGPT